MESNNSSASERNNSVNETLLLKEIVGSKPVQWVTKNTAVLIVHGIGNQFPMETLDMFTRGLITEFKNGNGKETIKLEHKLIEKHKSEGGDVWFDNVIRICKEGEDKYIDIYEYYWANYTEGRVDEADITKWINGVVSGAESFYARSENAHMVKQYSKNSSAGINLVDKNGNLNSRRYKSFLRMIQYAAVAYRGFPGFLIWLASKIPFIGSFISSLLKNSMQNVQHSANNVIGDIVVYNVTDPKCKYYSVRRDIADGAIKALRSVIEKKENEILQYDAILVAGHSLGSQIAYDAINRLNLLITTGNISDYEKDGKPKNAGKSIEERICGFVTFGSPLDKVAFFLREIVSPEMYLRKQLVDNYHCFKQRRWNAPPPGTPVLKPPKERLFEDIHWRNYYDMHDYVSGALDFYYNLKNINCEFKVSSSFSFTHSNYWNCEKFYKDIISNFLN